MWSFQAVALDLDGTLAEDDQLAESAMDAIKASSRELRMILVIRRIPGDLEAAFPGLGSHFDAVIPRTVPCCTPDPACGRWQAPPRPGSRAATATSHNGSA